MKLDLHTHCMEAVSFQPFSVELASRILEKIQAKGLDGIAITEHWDRYSGQRIKELVEEYFPGQALIIPGQEIDVGAYQVVELFLPTGSVFRFLAHPGYVSESTLEKTGPLHGIELYNGFHPAIPRDKVKALAEEHGLLLLSNSDAHYLDHLGTFYNEISLEELCARADGARPDELL